jgi:exosome complex component RRP42
MAQPLVPELLRAHLAELASRDQRADGRGRWEGRELSLEVGVLDRAEGSARVRMGDTIVFCGIKFQIQTPYPDRPDEGGLMTSAELSRVVDRGIRESGCIDTKDLCIIPGEKVWQVIIDCFAISDDGNLFDAFGLAAIAALHNATLPGERFDIGEDRKFPVNKTPIMCSFQKVGGRFVYDSNREEEVGGDERIHITLGEGDHVHSLQKGLKGAFTASEFVEIMEAAKVRCSELRKLVDSM